MFQPTIQDVLALAESGQRPLDVLKAAGARILAFEPFQSGELVARTEHGLLHFVIAPGLGEAGGRALEALGDEPTFRVDTAAELRERAITDAPGLASLLVLRIEAPGVTAAAIVLGHARAWSFAAASLFRIRTIGNVALRMVMRASRPQAPSEEVARAESEMAGLRKRISTLESDLVRVRAERASRKGSDKPQ
jgi:hypothetical protein